MVFKESFIISLLTVILVITLVYIQFDHKNKLNKLLKNNDLFFTHSSVKNKLGTIKFVLFYIFFIYVQIYVIKEVNFILFLEVAIIFAVVFNFDFLCSNKLYITKQGIILNDELLKWSYINDFNFIQYKKNITILSLNYDTKILKFKVYEKHKSTIENLLTKYCNLTDLK